MSDLLVFTYPTENEAAEALRRVAAARQDNVQDPLVAIRDGAVAIKTATGKVKVAQTLEAAVKGTRVLGGGFWGLLIGFLFGGPLVGALVGMGLRAFGNHSIDFGIDNRFIDEISDALEPGSSALFLLTFDTSPEDIDKALGDHRGVLHHTSLSDEAAEALVDLADDDEVASALSADEG